MTKQTGVVLAIVGAVGVLALTTLLGVAAIRGNLGHHQALSVSSCGPRSPQGTVVNVDLSDHGGGMMGGGNLMMVSAAAAPNTVIGGTVTFVATNTGALNHELLVLPAPADGIGTRPVGTDGKITESSSLGEASTSCGEGTGDGISPGTTSWVTLHLAPGNYELLCDEPWHYANGMFTSFSVQGARS